MHLASASIFVMLTQPFRLRWDSFGQCFAMNCKCSLFMSDTSASIFVTMFVWYNWNIFSNTFSRPVMSIVSMSMLYFRFMSIVRVRRNLPSSGYVRKSVTFPSESASNTIVSFFACFLSESASNWSVSFARFDII